MNTSPRGYHDKCREKMETSRSSLVILTAIILIGTVGLSLTVSSLDSAYIKIASSGSVGLGYAPPLHVEGTHIKDDEGNVVYLRGVNKPHHIGVPGGWWHPEGSMNDYGYRLWLPDAVKYNLDRMRSFGFNTLRLFLPDVQRWLADQDEIDCGVTARDRFAYIIDQANRRGMYVMLVTYAVGDPYGGQTGIPWDPYTKPTERGILTSPEDFINYWAGSVDSISAEYGHFPNVIYELWNEPNGWSPEFDMHRLYFDTCQEIVDRLRAKGDNHLVVYQFNFWGQDSAQAVAQGQILNGTNIVYGIHAYRKLSTGFTYYFPNGEYLYEDVRRIMLDPNLVAMQNLVDNNLPGIITEFGYNSVQGDSELSTYGEDREAIWFGNIMRLCNELDYGYTVFQWRSDMALTIFESNNEYPWVPPLNRGGEELIRAIAEGPEYAPGP